VLIPLTITAVGTTPLLLFRGLIEQYGGLVALLLAIADVPAIGSSGVSSAAGICGIRPYATDRLSKLDICLAHTRRRAQRYHQHD